jgi:putative hemolysin
MDPNIYLILVFSIALILDIVTIAARSGLVNASPARLHQLREQFGPHYDHVQQLVATLSKAYAGTHFCLWLCRSLMIGSIVFLIPWVEKSLPIWVIALLLILIWLGFTLLEWIIERFVAKNPEVWIGRLRNYLQILSFVFSPLISLSFLLTREEIPEEDISVDFEEDLKLMVEAGQKEGILEQEEGQMIVSIFQLNDTLTREIMVPRIEMLALDINTSLTEALDTFMESGYSRVPVYEGRMDNIIGILYAKDLLRVSREVEGDHVDIRSQLREPYFVPEAKKADELLAEMQSRRVHMAIVVDEYGGVAGVVTLEDIVEEILGEIQDEYDVEDLPFQAQEDGSYLFRGRIDIDDFNHIMDSSLPPEEADTLSGFIYGRLGHVPVAGEQMKVEGMILSVEQVTNRRIRTVRAKQVPSEG